MKFYVVLFTFFAFSLFGNISKPKYDYDICICAIFRDEAPYLKEWIEFHRLVGVQKFYLYNNFSTDNYKEVLQPYINEKIVILSEWPRDFMSGAQQKAYQDAINKLKYKTKWIAFIDIDEFLFPVNSKNLVIFLKDYEECASVCVNWQLYGTSFVEKIPEGKLLIESLCRKAPKDYQENSHVKSIVRPEFVKSFSNPHCFNLTPGFFQVDADHQEFSGACSPNILVDKIRINHYWARDEDFFRKVKLKRNLEGIQKMKKRLGVLNSEEDTDRDIFKFVQKLRKRVFESTIPAK